MDFQYSEEQTQLTDSIKRFVDKEYSFENRRKIVASADGYSPRVWSQLAEMGLMSIPLPADHGGYGGGAVDLIGVMEAFGDALVVEPYLATVILGGGAIARAGSAAQQSAILPAVAEGKVKLALAHSERAARYSMSKVATRAVSKGGSWVLNGEKIVVLGAPSADQIVVSARTAGSGSEADGISLFLVDRKAAGLSLTAYSTMDDLRAADLRLANVTVPADALLGQAGGGLPALEAVFDFANAVLCAEAVGAMGYANRATLEYLKTRKQFGQPIGAFQALQHRMVDMTISAEQSRSMVFVACTSVNGEKPPAERARLVSAARIRIADASRHVSQESVQLHGGMGMTEELKVSHTFRRLTLLAKRFGDADHHLQRFTAVPA